METPLDYQEMPESEKYSHGRFIAIASGIFGIGLISFSLSHVLWLSFFLLLLTGFGMMVHMASSNTILQTMVDDDKGGRVMSLYGGMAPFGSLAGGSLAVDLELLIP